jgi:large subunit ribosomal protein L25
MKEIVLETEPRTLTTKGSVKVLRRNGRIPAVAYGDREAPATLSVDAKALWAILHSEGGRNALINLKMGESSHAVLIKEIQRDPITRLIRHVDFQRVSLKQPIETKVPLHVQGEAPGVKLGGGVLEHLVREIRVRCLPTEIPSAVDVDISNLQLNQGIKLKDLSLPKGVEVLTDSESVIVHVVAVHVVEETPVAEAAAAVAEGAEPEVIKKGKTEEEGAEAAAAPAGEKKAAASAPAKSEAKKPEAK